MQLFYAGKRTVHEIIKRPKSPMSDFGLDQWPMMSGYKHPTTTIYSFPWFYHLSVLLLSRCPMAHTSGCLTQQLRWHFSIQNQHILIWNFSAYSLHQTKYVYLLHRMKYIFAPKKISFSKFTYSYTCCWILCYISIDTSSVEVSLWHLTTMVS